jgi:hypothetical protein
VIWEMRTKFSCEDLKESINARMFIHNNLEGVCWTCKTEAGGPSMCCYVTGASTACYRDALPLPYIMSFSFFLRLCSLISLSKHVVN